MRKPCCFLFVLLLSGLLLADFNPPQWRGFPGSTYQKWSFSNSDISPIADDYSNPYGMPRVSQPIVGNWIDQSYNGHQGVWFSDTISYLVPNEAEAMNKTRYRVQIIWAAPTFRVTDMSLYICNTLGNLPVIQANIVDQFYNSGWNYTTFEADAVPFISMPVVYCETRSGGYSQKAYVDEIIIDTIVTPEPTTLLLFGLGGPLLHRKK